MRTDEGVCPYFVALSKPQNYSLISFREASPPLGGGWEGFPIEGVCPYFVALFQI